MMMPLKGTKKHSLIGLHKHKDRPKDARCLNHSLLCFRYLATGNSMKSLAPTFRLGESTVRQII